MDCSPLGFSVHGNSPGKNTRVHCHFILQGIFPTQGSKPGLPQCRWIPNQGNPRILEWVAYPFSSRSSQPRNQTRVSCIGGRFFTSWAMREAHCHLRVALKPVTNPYKKRESFGYRDKEHTPRKVWVKTEAETGVTRLQGKTHWVSLAAPEAGKRPEMDSSSEPREGTKPADTLTSDLWPPEWGEWMSAAVSLSKYTPLATLENQHICSVTRAEGSAVDSRA